MDLTRLQTFHWASFLGAIAGILSLLVVWNSPWRYAVIALVVLLCIGGLFVEAHQGRLSALFSGVSSYYTKFAPGQNREVFRQVNSEYHYLGISFTTVFADFQAWYESEMKASVRIRLLLTDPQAQDLLEFQARFEKGWFDPQLTPEQQAEVSQRARNTARAIELAIQRLAGLRNSAAHIEVRLHREKLRKWAHVVDTKKVYVGLLRKGESGIEAPVLVLVPRQGHWTMFNQQIEEWESIWTAATPASSASACISG